MKVVRGIAAFVLAFALGTVLLGRDSANVLWFYYQLPPLRVVISTGTPTATATASITKTATATPTPTAQRNSTPKIRRLYPHGVSGMTPTSYEIPNSEAIFD